MRKSFVRHRCIRRTRVNVIAFLTIALAINFLTGCSLLQKVGILPEPETIPLSAQPYELHLKLIGSSDLNPNSQSRPSPVQVRVFLLEPQEDINDTGFEMMFDYADNVMEPRPLTTVTLRPGQESDLVLPAMKSESMLVIAAAYRDPYQSIWKAIDTLTPTDTVAVSANIGANAVTINPSP